VVFIIMEFNQVTNRISSEIPMHPIVRPGKFDFNIYNLTTVLHE